MARLWRHGLLDTSAPYGWVRNEVYLPRTAPRHLLLHLPQTLPVTDCYGLRATLIRFNLLWTFLSKPCFTLSFTKGCVVNWNPCWCNLHGLIGGSHTPVLWVTKAGMWQYYSPSLYQLESLHQTQDQGHESRAEAGGVFFQWGLITCVGARARGTSRLNMLWHNASFFL